MATILLVDDAEVLRIEMRAALVGAGFRVLEGGDGGQGLAVAMANPDIDVIISDLHMPSLDGISMCREIRKDPRFLQVPIVMLTTETSTVLKGMGKEVGVRIWIIKPCDPAPVIYVVRKLLYG